jgi:hypothetical protein
MKHSVLTIEAAGISKTILASVVVSESKTHLQAPHLEDITLNAKALIDTGSSISSISDKLAAGLRLKDIGQANADTTNGKRSANIYHINILLKENVEIANVVALEFPKTDQKFDIIIGMDILTLGDLAITNHNHQTVLSFRLPPGTEHIVFKEEGDGRR